LTEGGAGNSLSITKSGTGQWVLSGSNTYAGATNVQSGTLNLVGPNAWAPALAGTSVSTTGGTVLTGGRLNFDYTGNVGADPATTIKNILKAGAPGSFAAGQIRTSPAADSKHGIGWIDDTANSKVRVGFTYLGDANVDGVVNTGDFTALAAHFNNSGLATPGQPIWAEGDFNYDGKVNALDFNMVASNFGATAIAGSGLDAPALGTLVPEPASLGLLGSIALLGLRRRRAVQ
jgi:autotransporter-associated beta strand protein